MKLLGLEFLDLYLIHWPLPAYGRFVETFRALAHLRDQGRIRSIGVSNFEPEHLETLIDGTGIVPVVNQVELHPRFSQAELRQVHARLGIATEAWAPLGRVQCWHIRRSSRWRSGVTRHLPRCCSGGTCSWVIS